MVKCINILGLNEVALPKIVGALVDGCNTMTAIWVLLIIYLL